MTNAPAHAAEHNILMQVVAKIVNQSVLIDMVVLITVGVDGRPSVGGNLEPAQVVELLRQLIAAEDQIANVSQIKVPRDN